MPSSAASVFRLCSYSVSPNSAPPTTKASAGDPSNALAKARRNTSWPFHGDNRASMTTRRTSSPVSWKSRASSAMAGVATMTGVLPGRIVASVERLLTRIPSTSRGAR